MNAAPQLQVVPPDPKVHLPEMYEMCAKVFSQGLGFFGCRDWCEAAYIGNSHYDWNTATIGLLDGRIVTHFGVWGYVMRIGSAKVRATGVGLVATHADYRRRGLMTDTACGSIDLMRANGYDMCTVTGIAHYYDRFGFVPAWNVTEYAIEAHHLPAEKPRVRARKFEPGHRDDLARRYNRENARRTGTVVRPTFLKNQRPGRWIGYRWDDPRGKLAGYVVVAKEGDSLHVLDWAGDDGDTLAVVAAVLRKLGRGRLVFRGLHHDDPLRKRLMQQFYTLPPRSRNWPAICPRGSRTRGPPTGAAHFSSPMRGRRSLWPSTAPVSRSGRPPARSIPSPAGTTSRGSSSAPANPAQWSKTPA